MGLEIEQQIAFLKRIEFFDNFDDHELRQFLQVAKWLKTPDGTLIIRENTQERVFYILVKGEVSVFKTREEDGRSLELTTLRSGACFGEMSLVMDVKRTAGVISRGESFLLMVEPEIINSSNLFLQLKFYKRFCEILVARLIRANQQMVSGGQEMPPPAPGPPEAIAQPPQETPVANGPTADPGPVGAPNPTDLPPRPEKKEKGSLKSLPRRITSVGELPCNPEVASRIAPLLRGECENTLRLADLVQLDPALAWKVMQVGNSSFYRRSLPVGTVPHAMITVGIKQIQELLFAAVNRQQPSRKPFHGLAPLARAFWRHSVIVARIAALLRDVIRLSLTTDIYLAGLLHDIGILALDAIEPNLYPHLMTPDSELCADLCQAETDYAGIDHAQAGAMLGEGIGLPEAYLDVLRCHHQPAQANTNQLAVTLVHLAEVFAHIHGCGHCPGRRLTLSAALESPAWGIIQEFHRPFCEVNVAGFVVSFDQELNNTWSSVTDGLRLD